MNAAGQTKDLIVYSSRPNAAGCQDTLPGRYRGWVMALSMAAFSLAFLGWFNESWLYLYESPIWLNRYTEYAIILAFGLWRIRAEQNPYTRRRLIILVAVVTGFWWLIPWLLPMFEPYTGFVWSQPVFPALHTPGTLTFFFTLLLVLLFGRRIICGFGCPCVGIRETVGFPFRRFSLRSDWAWRLRHSKWFFFQHAERCLDCGVPGCRNACPLGNFIPDWLEAAARGDWQRAGDLAHATSPLPEVCGTICPQHRLCEGGCTRSRMEGAVTIGAVERSLVDQALNAGWRPPAPASRSGHRVAVIGAGPAGLSCAGRLNRMGVVVTVYDRAPSIGGLLRYGVPAFKLDKSLLDRRQALLEQVGIRFVFDTPVDQTLLSELLQSHDGIFLGLGAQQPRIIALPGQELHGVEQGLHWLKKVNSGERTRLHGEQVLILGGGDTAMDCARSARRFGAEVTVAYRGPEEGLRASTKEIVLAREEGVAFLFEHAPVQLVEEGQTVRTVFKTPQGIQNIESSDVILAFGQAPCPPSWLPAFDIATDRHGTITVDEQGRTTHPRIWAGGDNTLGPNLAVNAIAAGRVAAEGMLTTFGASHRSRRRA